MAKARLVPPKYNDEGNSYEVMRGNKVLGSVWKTMAAGWGAARGDVLVRNYRNRDVKASGFKTKEDAMAWVLKGIKEDHDSLGELLGELREEALGEDEVPKWAMGFDGPGGDLPAWAPPPRVKRKPAAKPSPVPADPGKWALAKVTVREYYEVYDKRKRKVVRKERVLKGAQVPLPAKSKADQHFELYNTRGRKPYPTWGYLKGREYWRGDPSRSGFRGILGDTVEIKYKPA